ncbi:T9SS type A sorting domain-containing protein [Dyadobacter frigoris]|uniref:T9SS type A sorting domain-containing protein n=1 Tax=Dyadobacter frigoris TaxID=2576211 RepID=UPI001484D7EA|nr:T9SS type A sorting domain-containing protein [Dyadobacter frigoris]
MKIRSNVLYHGLSAYYSVLLLVFCFQSSFAQQGGVSSGGNVAGSGGSVSYSVGQVFYISTSAASGTVNQGVQQPFANAPLPVTLVSFEALPVTAENSQHVLVHWETAFEINNDFFTVERSVNGTTFAEVARVDVTISNSSTLKKYSWTDALPYSGVSYYRLKQTDLDQTFAYSTIRAVRINNIANAIAYPNPVQGYLHLLTIKNEIRTYQIFDLSGRIVENSKLAEGESIINMSRLSPAAYMIRIVGESEIKQFKIIKN